MRWLIVLPFERPEHMGMDFAAELTAMGHDVRTFAYRRDNPLYKNRSTKSSYQAWIAGQLIAVCKDWQPDVVLVIKGGPIPASVVTDIKRRTGAATVNVYPDSPLWMDDLAQVEAYDVFFIKDLYMLRAFEQVGLRNVRHLPTYCVPASHHPVTPTEHPDEARAIGANARRRALAEHTIRHRIDEIVGILDERVGVRP